MDKKVKIILVSLIIIFILITIFMLTGNIKVFDDSIYNFLIGLRCDFLDTFFRLVTKLGNTISILLLVIILLVVFKRKNRYLLAISTLGSVGVNVILKNIIQRPRPDHIRLISQGGYSFPSGHAMISVAVYGMLIYIVLKNIKNKALKITLTIILSLIILLIGLSRIYVGVHYPSDILAGYTLASIILIVVVYLCNKYIRGNINEEDGSK